MHRAGMKIALPSFRRVTTSGTFLPEIDGLRFVAIFAVIAIHVYGYWVAEADRRYAEMSGYDRGLRAVIELGDYGVHLFFAISGFVLAMPFCRHAFSGGKPVDLPRYFLRRLTRLEPPYVISMILFFFTMPLFGKGTLADLFPHLLASLGYVHNIVYGCGSLINNNAWSLEVEVQFYLLMPLLAAALWLPAWTRRLLCCGAMVAFSLHSLWLPKGFPESIMQYAQYFLGGILLCDLWTNHWTASRPSLPNDLVGIGAIAAFAWVNIRHAGLVADIANPWLILAFFYAALRGRLHSACLSWGWIPIIGGMCYSIYLLHARVIAVLVHGCLSKLALLGSFALDYPILLTACLPAILIVSGLFFLLVERPCMNPAWPADLIAWVRGKAKP